MKPKFTMLMTMIILFSIWISLPNPSISQTLNSSCPLDFSILQKFITVAKSNPDWIPSDTPSRCSYALRYLHLSESEYLRTNSLFLLPNNSNSTPCWSSLSSLLSPLFPSPFSLLSDCGFRNQSLSLGCMNITSKTDFESQVPPSAIADMARNCNRSLGDSYASQCTACTPSLNNANSYLTGTRYSNVTTCSDYPFIYAGGVVNRFGPTDNGTASCLFFLRTDSAPTGGGGGGSSGWIFGVAAGCFVLAVVAVFGVWFMLRRRRERMKKLAAAKVTNTKSPALDSMASSTTLVKFRFEEIRSATKNFSRDNIIGRGGYGNVYRGFLDDGSEVALKRFKNCSAAGDASFEHEVEVIASVRHVNLVALRGYCTATTAMEGHQRIIVCDLMRNGSLHDHLFSSVDERKLSWPIRHRIAVGTARGLAYLHYGAQPMIIHRDIKGSNILLDEEFEPKVADFGLARFAPEGMSHVSTRVAGTLGYVAPEYALYGQLTKKSDVYSFGVVMLELLSGKKAFLASGNGQNMLIADWAWELVKAGRVLDVVEEGMEELGPREVMEKYVLISVLCSHPQMHARPTMDQVLKILETDVAVPSIPDRSLPIVANLDDIEKSVGSSGSGQFSNFAGYQHYILGNEGESDYTSNRIDGDAALS